MALGKIVAAVLSAWLLISQGNTLAEESPVKTVITRDEVKAYLAAHQAEWEAKMPAAGSRLAYFDPQWEGVRARLDALAAAGSPWKQAFWADAGRAAALQVPSYQTPDEKDRTKKKAVEAQEELWMRPLGDDMVGLSLAVKLGGGQSYGAKLRELVLAACNYPTWGKGGPNNDLACAHIVRGIAIAYDWAPNLFSDEEKKLICETIRRRADALLQGLYGKVYWASGYTENHNQVCVSALGEAGLAFYHEIPEAKEWLAAAMVDLGNIARFSNPDGSSAEGVPYWTYGTSFILEFIENTRQVTGADQYYNAPFLRNAVSYRIGSATSGLDAIAPWGDAASRDFRGPHQILYRLADQYQDGGARYVADHLPFQPRGGADTFVWCLLWQRASPPAQAPSRLDYHADVLDMVTTRSGWEANDYMLSAKSGYTNRNHSHLDAGALIFGWGSDWLLRTPGYGRGNNEPGFWRRSPEKGGTRWNYFSNATESESTLLINGKNQKWDSTARSTITEFVPSDRQCWTKIDLTNVYEDISQASRTIYHRRGDYLLILDAIKSNNPVDIEWLAQVPPNVQVTQKKLTTWSKSRGLAMVSLGDGTPFAQRAPTSPKIDVPKDQQVTYSSKIHGSSVRFAVLLEPLHAANAPLLKASSETDAEGRVITRVEGSSWKDVVYSSDRALPVFSQNAQAGDARRPIATGHDIVLRQKGSLITSVLLIGGSELHLPAADFQALKPFSLAAELEDDETWTIDLSTEMKGNLSLHAGYVLCDASRKVIDTSQGNVTILPAGKYTLSRTGH